MLFIMLFKAGRFEEDAFKINFRGSGGPQLFLKKMHFSSWASPPPLPSFFSVQNVMNTWKIKTQLLNRTLHSYLLLFSLLLLFFQNEVSFVFECIFNFNVSDEKWLPHKDTFLSKSRENRFIYRWLVYGSSNLLFLCP